MGKAKCKWLFNSRAPFDEDTFPNEIPREFNKLRIYVIKESLAAILGEWDTGNIKTPFYEIQSDQNTLMNALSKIKSTDFTAWGSFFFGITGTRGALEKIQSLDGESSVHDAPAVGPETNELFYADTGVTGGLWAIKIDSRKARKVKIDPPLANINGAKYHSSHIYVTTNGTHTRAIFPIDPLTGSATPVVNNLRGRQFNSPNDLVFNGMSNTWFTAPCYGWYQEFPSVQSPELPNTIYFLDMNSKALVAVSNDIVTAPNGLAFSTDGSTLYLADSNSTAGRSLAHFSAKREMFGHSMSADLS